MPKYIRHNSKEGSGITLIALVITIIVLLILAGISISMLSGDNSILKQAGKAKDKTQLSSLKEEAQIVMLNRVTEKTTSRRNIKTLKEDLESGIINATVENVNATDESEGLADAYYVKKNGQYVTVYEDGDVEEGKIEIWDGKEISCPELKNEGNVWNWYIYKPSQLKFLADFVNNGNKLDGREDLKKKVEDANYNISTVTMSTDTTIYLMSNLDLGARQKDGELIIGTSWTPIGTDLENVKGKLGTFEGNNFTIRGVYINNEGTFQGLFGNSNSIKNLTIKNSYIKAKYLVGGIVGRLRNGNIENCHNINTTVISTDEELNSVGGIAGHSSKSNEIIKCSNSGRITGNGGNTYGGYAGGIVGYTQTSTRITQCTNNGDIEGKGSEIGGIVGFLDVKR